MGTVVNECERRALGRRGADDGLGDRVERAFRRLGGASGYRKVAWAVRTGSDDEPPRPAPERRVRDAMYRR